MKIRPLTLWILNITLLTLWSCKKDNNTNNASNLEIIYDSTLGESGTELNEYNLQKGNMWHGTFATDSNHLYIKDVHNYRVQRLDFNLQAVDWFGYYNAQWGFHIDPNSGIDSIKPQNIYFVKDFLYITQFYFSNKILKISRVTGKIVSRYTFKEVSSFAVDNNYNLYVYSSSSSSITKYNDLGDSLCTFGSFGSDYGEFNTLDAQMIIDKNNNLYVYDSDNSRIQKFDSNGTFTLSWKVNASGWESFDLYKDKIYILEKNYTYLSEYNLSGMLIRQWKNTSDQFIGSTRFKIFNNTIIFEKSYDDHFLIFHFSEY